jgi:lipocalin
MKNYPSPAMLPQLITQANKSLDKVYVLIDDLLNTSKEYEGQLQINLQKYNLLTAISECCENVLKEGNFTYSIEGDATSLIEKDLRDLTEEYSLNEDGTIKVINRAFNSVKNKPVETTGTIKFRGAKTRGQLEVAYFLPIYLDYNILDVDENYQYALVSGSGLGYLWLLSRESSMPEEMKQRFLTKARELGFEISKLEWMDY